MADFLDQYDNFDDSTPEGARVKALVERARKTGDKNPGLVTLANRAVNSASEANRAAEAYNKAWKDYSNDQAQGFELVPKELLDSTTTQEKGIYRNNIGDFLKAIGKPVAGADFGLLGDLTAAKGNAQSKTEGTVFTDEQILELEGLLSIAIAAAEDAKHNAEKAQKELFTLSAAVQEAINQNRAAADVTLGDEVTSLKERGLEAFGLGEARTPEQIALERNRKQYEINQKELLKKFVTEVDPNENYLQHSFREQCFIQKNIYSLIKLRQGSNFPKKGSLPYIGGAGNVSVMCGGDPYAFMNKLTQPSSLGDFFDIPHDILSNLQPEVRLYKITMDKDGKDLEEIEITFPGNSTSEQIKEVFKNKKRRGYGVGMKSFEWSMEGTDPFSSKRMISAKLTIHASNFTELLRDRTVKDKTFKYVDLAIRTGTTKLQELTPAQCAAQFSGLSYESNYNINFRLKVVVGYAIPKNLNVTGDTKRKYDKAIADCFTSYDLSPTVHEFAFEEDGRVSFIINYQAYTQDYFDKSYFDIFANGGNNMMKSYQIQMQRMYDAATAGATTSGADPLPEKDDGNAVKKLKYDNLKILMTRLFSKDRVYFFNVPVEELSRAMSSNSMFPVYDGGNELKNEDQVRKEIRDLENQAKNAVDAKTADNLRKRAKEMQEELSKDSDVSSKKNKGFNSASHRQVAFFFFYDLIDTILEGIGDSIRTKKEMLELMKSPAAAEQVKTLELQNLKVAQENFKRLRVLLGPMEIRDPRNPKKMMYISMGEIPISVKYFSEWLSNKMLSKDRVSYNLSTFIDQFIKNHISVFLNDKTCTGEKSTQPAAFHNTTIISYSDMGSGIDNLTARLLLQNKGIKKKEKKIDYWVPRKGELHVLNTQGARSEPLAPKNLGYVNQKNWLVYYSARLKPSELMTGNRDADAARGISHYVVGQSTGIVKNITLEKTPAPMLAEMRYVQEGYDGLLQLRQVYNANVDMYLLPNTYPGTIIFVDPRGFAPDTRGIEALNQDSATGKNMPVDKYELSRYGIGGYYLVFKAKHRIAEGERSTQIQSVWMHGHQRNSNNNDDPKSSAVDKNSDANKIQKCGIVRDDTYISELVPDPADEVSRPFFDMGEQVIGGAD